MCVCCVCVLCMHQFPTLPFNYKCTAVCRKHSTTRPSTRTGNSSFASQSYVQPSTSAQRRRCHLIRVVLTNQPNLQYNMNLTSNTAASYPNGCRTFRAVALCQLLQGQDKEPRLKTSCTHLDKKLQYCSSDLCCINKRSYEPLWNHRPTIFN